HRYARIILVDDVFCEQPWRAAPLEVGDGIARSFQHHEDMVSLHVYAEIGLKCRHPFSLPQNRKNIIMPCSGTLVRRAYATLRKPEKEARPIQGGSNRAS